MLFRSALFTTIPQPIVGGMYCAMFGMIAAVGISNLQFVNLNSPRNLFIIGFAFFMGLSVRQYFKQTPFEGAWFKGWGNYYVEFQDALGQTAGALLLEVPNIVNTLGTTSMAVGAAIALILDNTIPGTDEERGLLAWRPDTPR